MGQLTGLGSLSGRETHSYCSWHIRSRHQLLNQASWSYELRHYRLSLLSLSHFFLFSTSFASIGGRESCIWPCFLFLSHISILNLNVHLNRSSINPSIHLLYSGLRGSSGSYPCCQFIAGPHKMKTNTTRTTQKQIKTYTTFIRSTLWFPICITCIFHATEKMQPQC